ncbi:DUF5675 family protein [Ferruginibacter paludis]|uniref:DUF5675 family protein n=1 Tax=Ferruginibacter paludis TaxID=1310417 RepID=UPI0025B61477|nr:DUF5675 family protein [Ferruginibacter paludis]MDN3654861.1 DUF5675 family protein [Ferruginibacter paludis]
MKRKISLVFVLLSFIMVSASKKSEWLPATDFNILIVRGKVENNLVMGQIFLDNKLLGNCYENNDLKIPTGKYSGNMRYHSGKNFVQSELGSLSKSGDFLLEMKDVPGRSDILLHAGNKPQHSKGCILLGPANKSADQSVFIDKEHPLFKLRIAFYGTEFPNSCPDKNLIIEIK